MLSQVLCVQSIVWFYTQHVEKKKYTYHYYTGRSGLLQGENDVQVMSWFDLKLLSVFPLYFKMNLVVY